MIPGCSERERECEEGERERESLLLSSFADKKAEITSSIR